MSKVLYIDWPCFGREDLIASFREDFGLEVVPFFHKDYTERFSDAFDADFDRAVEESGADFCFSYNFFPLAAEGCKRHGLKYIALVYDSPQVKLYSYRITYPTNYVFLFDKEQYLTLRRGGIQTVYYCPLPVNARKIAGMLEQPYDKSRTASDVSFVGSLYNEDHNIYDRMYEKLGAYEQGYLDALIEAQSGVYGYNFLQECLHPALIEAMRRAEDYQINRDGVETYAYIFADYYLARKLTSVERIRLLSAVGARFPLRLFTIDEKAKIEGAVNMGKTDYYTEMPLIFHDSRINLNISLRSIKSGIPLRCMDILGTGGFLLTNYQADFEDYFVAGEDYDYFTSAEDLTEKIAYYLSHETERAQIAARGHQKAAENHSFSRTLGEIFQVAEVQM